MLLCNGLYCSTHYYDPWVEQFAPDHRVVTFDYRGHGRSEDPANPATVTLSDLVEDAAAVLATISAVSDEPVVIVGHSMGVRVALELAARARAGTIAGIVLLCGSVWGIGDGLLAEATNRLAPPFLEVAGRASWVSRRVRDALVHPTWMVRVGTLFGGLAEATPRGPVEALARNVRRLDVRLMASLGRSYVAHSARPLLSQITVPTLQIVGAGDRLATPAHAAQVERELANCSHSLVVVVDDCTHLAPIEAPEVVHRAVRELLAKL